MMLFLPSAKPHGQHVVLQVRMREGGTFQENPPLQLQFLVSLDFEKPPGQHVVFQVKMKEEGRYISRKPSSTITIFGFLNFEVPGSTCDVEGKEEGGTFQENHLL